MLWVLAFKINLFILKKYRERDIISNAGEKI